MVIQELDLKEGLNILFNTPQLKKIDNKDIWYKIFYEFMKELYIDVPDELTKYMQYTLSPRMIKTMFNNYGISPIYYEKLNFLIQKDLIYYLEFLFQNKGSLAIFDVFQELFSRFYDHIDFYNVSVNKLLSSSGNYKLAYILKPLKLFDKNKKIYFPENAINYTGKFLMELSNFHNFKMFPIDTNLIYIHFQDIYSNSNNTEVFFHGVRAYANTRYQNKTVKLFIQKTFKYEELSLMDMEIILLYLNVANIRKGSSTLNQEFDFNFNVLNYSSSLIFNMELLDTINDLLNQYKNINYNDRKELNAFKRRWQYLLSSQINNDHVFKNFEELELYIQENYNNLYTSFQDMDGGDFITLLIDLYVTVISNLDMEDEYSDKYYNTLFQTYIIGPIFIKEFFEPLFKLFVNYFFPANLDFTNTLSDLIKLKDKFNTIALEENIQIDITKKSLSRVDPARSKVVLETFITEENVINGNLNNSDKQKLEILTENKDSINTQSNINITRNKDIYSTKIFDNSIDWYIWNKKRNAGINVFDKTFLERDKYLDTDSSDTYLFYNLFKGN